MVYATGNYEATKMGACQEAVINLVLSIILVPFLGISGVVIGTLVANAFRTIQYSIFVSKHILNRNLSLIVKHAVWMIFSMGIIIPLVLFIDQYIYYIGWIGWLIKAIVNFSFASVITIILSILFYYQDSIYLINKIKGIVH